MYHLDNTSGVPEMPEPKEQQSMTPRWFGESQEQGGISWPGADWFNVVQAELLNLLAAAGIEPDKKSYDQLSKAIPKLGDAALRLDLSSSDPLQGGSIVNIQEAKLSELTEISIFMAMTRADINTIRNTPGAEVNVGYALQALINKGHKSILFPHDVKGVYTLAGDVTVPPPVTLISFSPCVKPYTITDDSSFLNKGAVIRKAAGADYIFGPGTVPRFYGLLLDGRDSSRPLFNQQNQQRGGMLFNCGIYRFLYGIGSYAYTSVQVGMSSICSNNDGVYNLIDSRLINCTINANTRHGVYLRNGANNNLFQNIRNEWNGGVGYLADGSVGNIINGELVDRNGSANFAVLNGGGFLIGDVFSQRPGRVSAVGSSYNTHFYIEGAGSYIIASNVVTRTGIDDDGQGTLTPERVLTTGGGSTDMTFIANGCDLSGYTLSALRQITTAEKMILRGNKGTADLITTGLYQFQNGRGNVGGVKSNQVLTSGIGAVLTLSFQETGLADPTTAQATIPLCRTLLIESLTTGGVSGKFKLPFQIRRIVQAANVDLYTSESRSSPTGAYAVTGATGVNVSLVVNADATLTTVTLTSVDGIGRFLRVTILDN
ncbi:right-handed parallel beta-helix repeat-containing protein [Klebsiella pneumoniae]|uniref:right-handed parallel beta-helix repeat-containing protein n=1 Tax=Klebsiella pneumoniae TaxID=573 RepID=UPI0022EC2514|nr:right-handed parallel beta-helix repeat-containing protein [Klebsiella pneumoniae]MDA3999098.1 right-handed parallel beta-helix repeat-containing protein [Klebsiella pneumoniae]WPC54629.1 right-handed parallel beta-helix repeat-containing protein [Klebsiella pneumoniae]